MTAQSKGTEQAQSFSSPQEEALLTLMRASDALHRVLQHKLKPFGITANQYNVLRILRSARPAGLTCSDIGRRMITPEPDITRLLGRLKAQNLLSQHRDPADRRVVWTRIADRGLEALARLDGIVEGAPIELLGALSGQELNELKRLLNKIQCGMPNLVVDGIELGSSRNGTGLRSSVKPRSPASPRLHPRPE